MRLKQDKDLEIELFLRGIETYLTSMQWPMLDIGKKKWESRRHFKLDSGSWDEEDKVTAQENAELEAPFSESEIREAIFSSYSEGAPGPDGLPFYFIRNFGNALRGIFVIWLKNFR
jgi:hypothetical protein